MWDKLELLEITYDYVAGKWTEYRFLLGLIMLLFINLMTFTRLGSKITNNLSFKDNNFTLILAVFCFILITEMWIWAMRIRTKSSQYLYNRIHQKYKFLKKQ